MTEDRETQTQTETESGEEQIDEQGRNPTQQRMDEEGVEAAPVDADWTSSGPAGSDPSGPAEGSGASGSVASVAPASSGPAEGSDPSGTPEGVAAAKNEPIFEPDVPLVAEVNRETPPKSRKGLFAAVAGAFALLGAVLLRRRR